MSPQQELSLEAMSLEKKTERVHGKYLFVPTYPKVIEGERCED